MQEAALKSTCSKILANCSISTDNIHTTVSILLQIHVKGIYLASAEISPNVDFRRVLALANFLFINTLIFATPYFISYSADTHPKFVIPNFTIRKELRQTDCFMTNAVFSTIKLYMYNGIIVFSGSRR